MSHRGYCSCSLVLYEIESWLNLVLFLLSLTFSPALPAWWAQHHHSYSFIYDIKFYVSCWLILVGIDYERFFPDPPLINACEFQMIHAASLWLWFAHLPCTISLLSVSPSWMVFQSMGFVFLLCLGVRTTCFSLTVARPHFTLSIFISLALSLAFSSLAMLEPSDVNHHTLAKKYSLFKNCGILVSFFFF